MERAREGRLPGAGLAEDQDRRRRVGDARRDVEDLAHRRALGDEPAEARPVEERLAQLPRLVADSQLLDGAPGEEGQLVEGEGLRQVVVGALPDCIDRRLDGAVAGHDDDRPVRGDLVATARGGRGHR